jgi:hypothetical protein
MNKNIQQLALGSIFALACTLNMNAQVVSQKVGTNPTIITPSTAFEVESANKGVLLPRVALTGATDATTILAPTTSMLVYNTATAGTSPNNVTPGYYYWTGTAWTRLTNGTPSADWTLTGNAGTVTSTNFIGTTDAIDFVTRTNNTEKMRVTSGGNVGIGTTTPIAKLHVENGGLRVQTSGAATSGVFNGNLSNFQIFHPSGTDANIRLFNSGGSLILGVNETGAMVGNVGIGTTTPLAKLAVNGLASAVNVHGIFNINDENYPIDATTGRPGISMGYDITNDYGWIYSRRIGKYSRPLVFNQPEGMIVGVGNNNYVGIGTASPSTKLHIDNGTTAGAIRIVDGTQGAGKVLTSDANGVGTWKSPNVPTYKVTLPSVVSLTGQPNNYVTMTLTLPAGTYFVYGQVYLTGSYATNSYFSYFSGGGFNGANATQGNGGSIYIKNTSLLTLTSTTTLEYIVSTQNLFSFTNEGIDNAQYNSYFFAYRVND